MSDIEKRESIPYIDRESLRKFSKRFAIVIGLASFIEIIFIITGLATPTFEWSKLVPSIPNILEGPAQRIASLMTIMYGTAFAWTYLRNSATSKGIEKGKILNFEEIKQKAREFQKAKGRPMTWIDITAAFPQLKLEEDDDS